MKTLTTFVFLFAFGIATVAQGNDDKFATLQIETSAVCDMCVATIEKGFAFEKGVKNASVNLGENTVSVTYRKSKTDPEALRSALLKMGYAADGVLPDKKDYDNLHHCCKADLPFHDHGDH